MTGESKQSFFFPGKIHRTARTRVTNLALGFVALLLNAGAPSLLSAMGGITTGLLCGGAIGAMVVGHVGRIASLALGAALAWWAVPPR